MTIAITVDESCSKLDIYVLLLYTKILEKQLNRYLVDTNHALIISCLTCESSEEYEDGKWVSKNR
jgi:hypothetical protein